jgi:filamentous hemagglutinin family protein
MLLFLIFPSLAAAAPYGGKVASGTATIIKEGPVTNINQKTPNSSINWQGFSIAGHETVNFNQPSRSSMTLNRVVGNERSVIDGALNANGKVFLVNSNGVLFGQGASVNVGGLVASTLDIGDDDFTAGRYEFNGRGGKVVNMGRIAVPDGGFVVMLGEQAINSGVIVARQGTVSLNGADKVTLNFNGDSLVNVMLDKGAVSALVENKRAVYADGGQVILTAKAANDAVSSRVNNDGLIQAQTVGQLKGDIRLYAYGGAVGVDGVLDASAPKGDGGFIETSGDSVKIAETAVITTAAPKGKAGTWLIDPVDFTIAKSGGDMTGSDLSSILDKNGQIILSSEGTKGGVNGDINVNDVITWSSDSVLTLDAYHDININNAINVNGNGRLVLIFGNDYNILTPASFSGTVLSPVDGYPVAKQDTSGGVYGSINFGPTGGSLNIAGVDYELIRTLEEMVAISSTSQNGRFALVNDLDLNSQIFDAAVVTILNKGGIFTGLGHTVKNLVIATEESNVGLFGNTNTLVSGGTGGVDTYLRDIGIIAPQITGGSSSRNVGALVGLNQASIKNAYVLGGEISAGDTFIGGLIGRTEGNENFLATLTDVFSSAYVTGGSNTGGLVGYITSFSAPFDSNAFKITNAHSTGKVISNKIAQLDINIGGLVGYISGPAILNSYASGAVIIEETAQHKNVGGLVGFIVSSLNSRIEDSFATGDVYAQSAAGGLIGSISIASGGSFALINSYALGKVNVQIAGALSAEGVGGLIGYASFASTRSSDKLSFDRVYAKGDVTVKAGTVQLNYVGGLIGFLQNATNAAATSTVVIKNAHADGNVIIEEQDPVKISDYVGGLIGSLTMGTLENCYATGNVSGRGFIGGLLGSVGGTRGSTILNSYATGDVTSYSTNASSRTGGLIGSSAYATTSNSYATGTVNGIQDVGGLIGYFASTSMIDGSYSTGSVSGTTNVGGLVGFVTGTTTIKNSYTTGITTGQTNQGGLIGNNSGVGTSISNSYWNQENGEAGYSGNREPIAFENSRAVDVATLDSEVGGYIREGQTFDSATDTRNQRIEAERLENERLEAIRIENERLENERLEAIRIENERLENERLEAIRIENERLENERLEAIRIENERLENERLEAIRIENERLEAIRIENERQEAIRAEENRLAEVAREAIVRSVSINSASSPTKGQILQVSFQSPSRADPPRSSLAAALVDANGISMTEPKFNDASFSADIRTVESGGFSLSRSENSAREGADSGGISSSGSEDSAQEEDE